MSNHKWKVQKDKSSIKMTEDSPEVENSFRSISFIINSYFMGHIEQKEAAKQVADEINGFKK